MMEYKSFPAEFQVKADDSEGMTFEGYASTFGNVDEGNDIIKKGAYKKTIRERFKQGLIKVLRSHWELIGIPIEMAEDDHGLFTVSKISKTPLGEETMTLVRDGALDRLSIGYKAIKISKDEETGIRTLKEIKLYEYSVVDFAMNEMAQITGSKALALIKDADIREVFSRLADERIQEALKAFDPSVALDDENEITIPPQNDKIKTALSALGTFQTALEDLLNPPEPHDSTQAGTKEADIDPAVLQSMLDEMTDINKTFSQIQ